MDGYKVKYFKDSIVGMKAKSTYKQSEKETCDYTGIISKGMGVNRFSLALNKPLKDISSIQLSEEDYIILIPD